jgi:glutamate-ammonia-ligase adenylyltransferase
MIKATPVAGDPAVGKAFQELISPFVWRKSLDSQTVDKMKEMKRKVHDSMKVNPSRGFHVKLDEGGIREIEFFVQTLQLLYGGTHPKLRTPDTLTTLSTLAQLDLIKKHEAKALQEAYLFLRRVEHRLQVVNEAQTHLVPHSAKEQMALARRMGYFEDDPEDARERFLDDLTRFTTMVKNTFRNLFE